MMMEFPSGMMDSHYHGRQDLFPHIYLPHPGMGSLSGQMAAHFTQRVEYGMPNGTPSRHSMASHQYGAPIHAQMSLPNHPMNISGFVPPHVPLDTNYRTNPGFIRPAHSGMVGLPAPISLSPPLTLSRHQKGTRNLQNLGRLPGPGSCGAMCRHPTPSPAPPTSSSPSLTPTPPGSKSGSPDTPRPNGVITPGECSGGGDSLSRSGSADKTRTTLKMSKGALSTAKPDVGDISPGAYVFNEEDKKFWCVKCNYSTPRLDKVVQHIKAHKYSKWRCEECGKAFIKSCDMERHANAHAMGRARPKAKGQIGPTYGNTTFGANSQSSQQGVATNIRRLSADTDHVESTRHGTAARSDPECIFVGNEDGTCNKISVCVRENNSDGCCDKTPSNRLRDTQSSSRVPLPGSDNTESTSHTAVSDRPEGSTIKGIPLCQISYDVSDRPEGSTIKGIPLCQISCDVKNKDGRGDGVDTGGGLCDVNTSNDQISAVDPRVEQSEPGFVAAEYNLDQTGAAEETGAHHLTEAHPGQNCCQDRPGLSALRGLLQRSSIQPLPDTAPAVSMGSLQEGPIEVSVPPPQEQGPLDAVADNVLEDVQPNDVPKLQPVLNPNATSSRQLCCNLCSYATKDMWHLEKHFLAHTRNYKTCKHCGKAFERPSDLVRHEERHTQRLGGEKSQISPMMVDQVPVRISSPSRRMSSPSCRISSPNRRVKISPVACRRPRVYNCDMCDKKFIAEPSLQIHKNSMHHSVVARLDAYRMNVLLHTKLIQCEVGNYNQVTLKLSPPQLGEITTEEAEVPGVSIVSDVFSIMKQAENPAPGQDHGALVDKANDILLQNKTNKAIRESGELEKCENNWPGGDQGGTTSPHSMPRPSPEPVTQPDPDPTTVLGNNSSPLHPFIHGINKKRSIARRSLDGNYRCPKCNYSTNVKTKMEIHQKAHTGRYVCKLCGKAFVKTSDLTRHWVCHNTIPGSTFLSCDSCTFRTEDKQILENHMKEHYRVSAPRASRHVKQWASPEVVPSGSGDCNQAGVHQSPPQSQPKTTDHSSGQAPAENQTGLAYYCHDCGHGYSSAAELKRHRVAKHGTPGGRVRLQSQDLQMKMCRYCGKQFIRQHHLKRHEQFHVKGLHVSKPTAPPAQVNGQMSQVKSRKYECRYCGKDFCRPRQLERHENFHALGRNFTAPTEGKETEGPFVCKYCDKEFSRAGNLSNHMQFHLGLKGAPSAEPAECQYCGKQFSTAAYLKQHIRLHTGETPFSCDACGKRFAMKQNMIVHKRRANCGTVPTVGKKRRRKKRRFFNAIW